MLGRRARIGAIVIALWLVIAPIASAFSGADLPVLSPAAVSAYQTYYSDVLLRRTTTRSAIRGRPRRRRTPRSRWHSHAACRKHGLKVGQTTPDSTEVAFIAQSNAIVLDGCAEPPDPDDGVGDKALKTYISAVKAKNPDVHYVAPTISRPSPCAGSMADLTGPYPVGLPYIVKNHEDWFVHQKGAAPTPGESGAEHRQRAAWPPVRRHQLPRSAPTWPIRSWKSMDFHGIWGISLVRRFDGGVAVFNYGTDALNASLGAGYINADGSAPTSVSAPQERLRSGARPTAWTPPAPTPTPPLLPPTCTPRPPRDRHDDARQWSTSGHHCGHQRQRTPLSVSTSRTPSTR